MRDDFSEETKRNLAARTSHSCSNPLPRFDQRAAEHKRHCPPACSTPMHSQRLGPEHPRSLNSLRRDAWPDCTPAQKSQRDFAARETRRGLAFLPRERAAIDSLKTSGLRVVDRGDDRGQPGLEDAPLDRFSGRKGSVPKSLSDRQSQRLPCRHFPPCAKARRS